MFQYLGIDTSNYTTSVALYEKKVSKLIHSRKILTVKDGECGLRQSSAVFQHVQKLPEVLNELIGNEKINLAAVGVSSRPRDVENSYMPCFTVGLSVAKCIAQTHKVPCYEFSHQSGHIVAALFSIGRLDLLKKSFIAFHVSGGTTEAVLVTPKKDRGIDSKLIARSLDLNAGQLIDRVGVKLGLSFPCGKQLDELSRQSKKNFNVTPCIKNFNCCLSGAENICIRMIHDGYAYEDVAFFCIEFISKTLLSMCGKIASEYGNLPIIFAGGVASNHIVRKRISEKFNVLFATPEFSSDNACGIAVLASEVK